MKKFNFRLQRLLDIRCAEEKKAQNELAELVNIQNKERAKQNDFSRKLLNEKALYRNQILSKEVSYNKVLMYEKFTDAANKAIIIAESKIEQMKPAIQKVREKLIDASKERKIVEKLKEKKFKEHLYELNREIAKENDDVNQKIYLRKRAEELN